MAPDSHFTVAAFAGPWSRLGAGLRWVILPSHVGSVEVTQVLSARGWPGDAAGLAHCLALSKDVGRGPRVSLWSLHGAPRASTWRGREAPSSRGGNRQPCSAPFATARAYGLLAHPELCISSCHFRLPYVSFCVCVHFLLDLQEVFYPKTSPGGAHDFALARQTFQVHLLRRALQVAIRTLKASGEVPPG